jgi:hypothetical protein
MSWRCCNAWRGGGCSGPFIRSSGASNCERHLEMIRKEATGEVKPAVRAPYSTPQWMFGPLCILVFCLFWLFVILALGGGETAFAALVVAVLLAFAAGALKLCPN